MEVEFWISELKFLFRSSKIAILDIGNSSESWIGLVQILNWISYMYQRIRIFDIRNTLKPCNDHDVICMDI
jgi:hypothetical protein